METYLLGTSEATRKPRSREIPPVQRARHSLNHSWNLAAMTKVSLSMTVASSTMAAT